MESLGRVGGLCIGVFTTHIKWVSLLEMARRGGGVGAICPSRCQTRECPHWQACSLCVCWLIDVRWDVWRGRRQELCGELACLGSFGGLQLSVLSFGCQAGPAADDGRGNDNERVRNGWFEREWNDVHTLELDHWLHLEEVNWCWLGD